MRSTYVGMDDIHMYVCMYYRTRVITHEKALINLITGKETK